MEFKPHPESLVYKRLIPESFSYSEFKYPMFINYQHSTEDEYIPRDLGVDDEPEPQDPEDHVIFESEESDTEEEDDETTIEDPEDDYYY